MADYLWFPPWGVSTACRNPSSVGNDSALAITFVDYLGISHDKEDPETVHEYTGHQAKPAHDSNLYKARVIGGEDLYYNVQGFIEKDPDDVDHHALVLLGIYWVYEQAADDDGDARQKDNDIETPTGDEVTY